ncbi:hypothetical protein [Pontimicrobium aquaticum]|uniref:Uncharacterized protein n=1 Tax=Pontimicrobium aquaticum TaxID=2565367 RepID=A0A4U0ELH1_9FLAO|nr:hypothetical protein [Pontimicrobium aquaticum]TJY31844.1 hypothetical protein E5167_14915 [Pontimicrobium aquaticum]
MKKLILLLVACIAFNANALVGERSLNTKKNYKTLEQIQLEATLFSDYNAEFDINSIEVIEIEEEVQLGFDVKQYLPENFNALEGKNNIDWSEIELIEVEEELELGFDTKQYLPESFNALEGKNNIDWSKIELIEVEEELELGFDTKQYLPKNFNPYKGMKKISCEKEDVVVCLY